MSSMVLASKLRHPVTIEQYEDMSDGAGGSMRLWEPLTNIWADIQPISANEQLHALQVESRISHRVTIYYRNDVLPGMRIHFRSRFLYIRAIMNPEEKNHSLTLLCEETL